MTQIVYETNARLGAADRARLLSDRYEGAAAGDVLSAAIKREFPGRIGLVSSFGTEAVVLLHMVSRIDPFVPVIFLDTLKHFPETLGYRDRLSFELGLCNVQLIRPRRESLAAEDPDGTLSARKADLCCHVRKTVPMLHALRPLDCWITGRKRHQAATRATLGLFEAQDRWIKLNPLADWTPKMVSDYVRKHDLPEHPLKAQGFASVGCAPCTRPVAAGEDARAGRWAESEKTECGIHFVDGKIVRG
ncbi:phosphoadenylyl-sulfate reductase [Palleronia rufa]|uniref:phosphoadenylyl-sulfate reductase n=1 Tax=Palleronia rufa TaxID=1530186 RepID=UPI001268453F|nr:phosphoadenylyl-sulfate reductase [Palleronia rufa]